MFDHVVTVQTQAQQLWFTRSLTDLGWTAGSAVVQGYPPVLGQWLDASHALERETWGTPPACLLYFCDTLPATGPAPPPADTTFPARQLAGVIEGSKAWLDSFTGLVWPGAAAAGSPAIDYQLLADPAGRSGDARLAAQYWRANVEPSERFVLSVTGSTKHRLAVDESGVDGLYLTGDWVRNGFNVGSLQSTIFAGLQCARAISGEPIEIVDEHFFVHR
jgi:hypothetical protein